MDDHRNADLAPVLGHKMERKAEKVLGPLQSMLAPGEQVRALFVINVLRPMSDFLAVTNCRVVTGHSSELDKKRQFGHVALAGEIEGLDSKGRITRSGATGEPNRLPGPLHRDKDLAALTHFVDLLVRTPAPEELLDSVRGGRGGEFVPPTAADVHLGSSAKIDLRDQLPSVHANLVPGESLRALFAVKGPVDVRLLAFTDARILGLTSGDEAAPEARWWLTHAGLVELRASSVGTLTASIEAGGRTTRMNLGSLQDAARNSPTFNHFAAERPSPRDEVTQRLLETGLPRPDGSPHGPSAGTRLGTPDHPVVPPRVGAESRARALGVAEKSLHLVGPVLDALAEAEDAAAAGDIETEEHFLREAGRIAGQAGFLAEGRVRAWLDSETAARLAAGRLRRGSVFLGKIGISLQVFSDRLLHRGICHVLDGDVVASVEVDGQILTSSRPTLTRMAFGSVLPGSALIVGMALPKGRTDDRRSANFIVAHPEWRIAESLDPDKAADTKGVAAQINAIAARHARRETAADDAPVSGIPNGSPAPVLTVADQLAQLERVDDLWTRGLLDQAQAGDMRRRILEG
jgi:hypothetical protein